MPGMTALTDDERAALQRMDRFRKLATAFRLRAALSWATVTVASSIEAVLDDNDPEDRALRAELADRKAQAYHDVVPLPGAVQVAEYKQLLAGTVLGVAEEVSA